MASKHWTKFSAERGASAISLDLPADVLHNTAVMAENVLYYGDNLDILRRYIKDETIDLVYLDPPFKSNQDYNVLFAEKETRRILET